MDEYEFNLNIDSAEAQNLISLKFPLSVVCKNDM